MISSFKLSLLQKAEKEGEKGKNPGGREEGEVRGKDERHFRMEFRKGTRRKTLSLEAHVTCSRANHLMVIDTRDPHTQTGMRGRKRGEENILQKRFLNGRIWSVDYGWKIVKGSSISQWK
ncbi:hypothetical protein CEXT_379411 [Caerostris extrusa]|uniref:Uncharacterized protein n=1 Tax=Caerostris extrusa TaxID=172846 RepID=A0AAV4YBT2_CAEEX|nr:hypothetical protein CEXT_379411 [Caerostris extrusa]